MNAKTMLGLALVCLVLFGAYRLSHNGLDHGADPGHRAMGARPFADVDFSQVGAIRIFDHAATTHLVRVEGAWGVEQKNNYPSDFTKLTTFVRSLPEKQIGQEMVSGEAYLEEYGLSETGEEKPVTVRFETDAGETLLDLRVGARRDRGGQFVQLASGHIVLMGEGFSQLSSDPDQWIDRSLIALNETEIESFTIQAEDGEYTLKVKGPGQYELDDLKEGETLKQFEPGRIGRALQNLQLVSVYPKEDVAFKAEERFMARTKDGRTYTVQIGPVSEHDPNSRYATVSVEYTAPESSSPDDEDPEPTTPTVEKTVDEQTAAWSPWVFTLMNYSVDSMTLSRESLIDHTEEENTAGE